MPVRIFFRHGEKAHHNLQVDRPYPYDSDITKNDLSKAQAAVERLLEEFGPPTELITSPYRRCIQTSNWLLNLAEDIDPAVSSVHFVVDPRLSEYYGSIKTIDLGYIHPDTIHYHPLIHIGRESLVEAVRGVVGDAKESSEEVVWYVTHGTVLARIADAFGIHRSRFKTLDYLIVHV